MKFKCFVIDPPYSFKDKLSMSDVARSAESNYDVLSINEIKLLKIKDIADTGAILSLWVPSSLLQEGLDIMKSYGFTQKQTYIWVKSKLDPFEPLKDSFMSFYKNEIKNKIKDLSLDIKSNFLQSNHLKNLTVKSLDLLNTMMSFGMGRLFRQCHELALIGTNSNLVYKNLLNKSQRSVSLAPNLKHSAKPSNLQDSLDLMFNVKKIEIFARNQRKGWVCVGNEAPMTYGEDISVSIEKLKKLSKENEEILLDMINNYDSTMNNKLSDFWKNV